MLRRNLVYTGVTRGKQLVVLVGQRKALAILRSAMRAPSAGGQKLNQWLRDEVAPEG
jgi:exodeoxyribonuclease V alpha subunit